LLISLDNCLRSSKLLKQAVREATTLTFHLGKWCPSHMWRGLPLCQF